MKKIELDDLVRDSKHDLPKVDWKAVDEKLFDRLEREPRPLAAESAEETTREGGGRVVWIGAAFTLAAAAAALVFIHPGPESVDSHAQLAQPAAAADMIREGAQLSGGDRIDVVDEVAYFESPGKVRWSAPRGSVLRVEHSSAPLVLSLEKGAAEAQVTPVPSGEAFAIDVTASNGDVVRVAVHGTHLRVAREGDRVTVDLTEGVVSIGAPPRRGSTIGTLVTAPAHVELDARNLAAIVVDHDPSAVRPAERVTPAPRGEAETASLPPPSTFTQHDVTEPAAHATHAQPLGLSAKQKIDQPSAAAVQASPTWLTTTDELASALAECGRNALKPPESSFATTLTIRVGDDGMVQSGLFVPPLLPEARDCADNVIYKRTKLTTSGRLTVPIQIEAR